MNVGLKEYLKQRLHIEIYKMIGVGLTSQVFSAKKGQIVCAVKVYNFGADSKTQKKQRIKMQYDIQVNVLQVFKRENGFVSMIECGIFQQYGFVIMELLPLCLRSLCDKLFTLNIKIKKQEQGEDWLNISEQSKRKEIKKIIKILAGQQLKILQRLQHANIIHRDLKLENLLIDQNSNIKLIDFGAIQLAEIKNTFEETEQVIQMKKSNQWAKIVQLDAKLNGKQDILTGSKHYISPEMIGGKRNRVISTKIDIWSFGVILYRLLCGSFPFEGSESAKASEFFHLIREQQPTYPSFLEQGQKEILKACLKKNPNERPFTRELMNFGYFSDMDWQLIYNTNCISKYISKMNKRVQQILYRSKNENIMFCKYMVNDGIQQISNSFTNLCQIENASLCQKSLPTQCQSGENVNVCESKTRMKRFRHVVLQIHLINFVKVLKILTKSNLGVTKLFSIQINQIKINQVKMSTLKFQNRNDRSNNNNTNNSPNNSNNNSHNNSNNNNDNNNNNDFIDSNNNDSSWVYEIQFPKIQEMDEFIQQIRKVERQRGRVNQ